MRALVCTHYNDQFQVELQNLDAPNQIEPHEVMIQVHYASVSHAMGLMIAGKYQTKPPLPFIPGTEAVGKVIHVGTAVTDIQVGDMVLAIHNYGCYAEQIVVPKYTVYPLPKDLPALQALPIPISYGTAYTGLAWRCKIQPTDTVLVLGAGAGVGLAAVEIAVQMGAQVIACTSTEEKRQMALKLGAFAAVSPDANLATTVKTLTNGQGASIIVDPVGGELAGYALRAAAPNAQILSIGFASGSLPNYAPNYLLVKNLSLHGFFYGQYIGWTPTDERIRYAASLKAVINTLLHWAKTQRINPTVSQLYKYNELTDALHALQNRQIIGKAAISFIEETT